MIACRKQFTDTLLELAREDKDIIAVTTDARGSVTLGDYANALPEQFVECGIAEQDAVGISAGLAHSGKKVFCCGPACFYVARSLEQVKVDLAYSENPVTILGVSGGVAYGALGATHHSLHDIAVWSGALDDQAIRDIVQGPASVDVGDDLPYAGWHLAPAGASVEQPQVVAACC